MAKSRRIHLINPRADTFATRPLFFGKALYSPVAGLLAVAALIPEEEYEIILTDENIEPIDFDLKIDMVGISAMTSYVKRGYEIADTFRAQGIPVIMGGVHVSYLPEEALKHADAVVVFEVWRKYSSRKGYFRYNNYTALTSKGSFTRKLSLPKGSYRVRIKHGDLGHSDSASTYDYFKVR